MMRIQLVIVLALVACALVACAPVRASSPGDSIAPVLLRYRAQHRGDHPPADLDQELTIERVETRGVAVWRGTYAARFEGALYASGQYDVDAKTLLARYGRETVGDDERRVEYLPGVIRIERATKEGVAVQRVSSKVPCVGDMSSLDLYLASLPFARGFRTTIGVLDHDRATVSSLAIEVVDQKTIQVPAGTFCTWVLSLTQAGQAASTYHVTCSAPHHAIRKEFVVFPSTTAEHKRSAAVEELTELRRL